MSIINHEGCVYLIQMIFIYLFVCLGGQVWHQQCFVCAQCFRPFTKDAIFYEFEGRKYCEHDFHVLFAPCCVKCSEFIIGKIST